MTIWSISFLEEIHNFWPIYQISEKRKEALFTQIFKKKSFCIKNLFKYISCPCLSMKIRIKIYSVTLPPIFCSFYLSLPIQYFSGRWLSHSNKWGSKYKKRNVCLSEVKKVLTRLFNRQIFCLVAIFKLFYKWKFFMNDIFGDPWMKLIK